MLGLGGALALAGAGASISVIRNLANPSVNLNRPIVAWGDSLTYGYPDLAAALFEPARSVIGMPVGGQTSTQIAARMGAVPILVTLEDDTIPEAGAITPDLDWTFEGADSVGLPNGWRTYSASDSSIYGIEDNTLRCNIRNAAAGPTYFPGIQVDIGGVSIGDAVRIEFEVKEYSNLPAMTAGLIAGSWLQGGQINLSAAGSYVFEAAITNDNGGNPVDFGLLMTHVEGDIDGILTLDSVRIFKHFQPIAPVLVTAVSVNPLNSQGPWAQGALRVYGQLLGVPGYLQHDGNPDSGAAILTFTRTAYGAAVSIPAQSVFKPDVPPEIRQRTAWLWAGRNNSGDPETVKSDIAAMIASLGHSRYLVGSVLNGGGEGIGTTAHTTISQLNADLATIYGARFVDIRGALLTGGNSSPQDTEDIVNGIPPRSLRTDTIHLNEAGQAIVAGMWKEATLARGW